MDDSLILIRQARPGDEIGMINLVRIGLRRKNWTHTGTNKVTKDKIRRFAEGLCKKKKEHYTFLAFDGERIVASATFSVHHIGRLRHRVDMGWGVHPDYQGRGIGTKLLATALAFAKKKGYKRAEAEAAVENVASWKIAIKCGFAIEGTKKKAMLTDDGRYVDTYILGKWL